MGMCMPSCSRSVVICSATAPPGGRRQKRSQCAVSVWCVAQSGRIDQWNQIHPMGSAFIWGGFHSFCSSPTRHDSRDRRDGFSFLFFFFSPLPVGLTHLPGDMNSSVPRGCCFVSLSLCISCSARSRSWRRARQTDSSWSILSLVILLMARTTLWRLHHCER